MLEIVYLLQAYTSQIIAMVMLALVLSADRISFQQRRREIIEALAHLPGQLRLKYFSFSDLISFFPIFKVTKNLFFNNRAS